MNNIVFKDELYHYGVLGQKWGNRQGPPYPLNPSEHSAAEKKAGYSKSIRKFGESAKDYKARLKSHAVSLKKEFRDSGSIKEYVNAARKSRNSISTDEAENRKKVRKGDMTKNEARAANKDARNAALDKWASETSRAQGAKYVAAAMAAGIGAFAVGSIVSAKGWESYNYGKAFAGAFVEGAGKGLILGGITVGVTNSIVRSQHTSKKK